jgi:hypothetical protein
LLYEMAWASGVRPENFSLRSTAGSPRAFDTLDLKQAKALLVELAA